MSAGRRNLPAVVETAEPVKAVTLRSTLAGAGDHAARRFIEFFAATIRNKNTRMAYYRAACHFFAWVEQHEIGELADIEPIHVAAYIEVLQTTAAKPTVKLHLAAIRMLFDWLVVGQVLAVNPAHSVRGPKHVVRRGKTPVLTEDQARRVLGSIRVVRKVTLPDGSETEELWLVGLRDRALMAVMTYTFARIGAVVGMRVEDYYPGGKRSWVRLREKGGKRHAMPCHHNLEEYLTAYLDGAGLRGDPKGPLFRIGRGTGQLTRTVLPQANAYAMIARRATAAGIATKLGNHSFRATGIAPRDR